MPQHEYRLGRCPTKDRPITPKDETPTWNQLLDLLARENFGDTEFFFILICGKGGSPGRENFAKAGMTDKHTVQHAAISKWDVNTPLRDLTGNPANTIDIADALEEPHFFYERPQQITGIIVRRLNI